jgi:hypothetical protein
MTGKTSFWNRLSIIKTTENEALAVDEETERAIPITLALPHESWAISGSALPPDVRRRLRPAVWGVTFLGYALGSAFGPVIKKAKPGSGA